jgi:hypothetical protein
MSDSAHAVDDYLALTRAGRWRAVRAQQAALVRKTYAQQLARAASGVVQDRKKRAEVKAEFYARMLPVLELHAKEQAQMRQSYQKLVGVLAGALLLAALALALLLY